MGVISVPAIIATHGSREHVWVCRQKLAVVHARIADWAVSAAHIAVMAAEAGGCGAAKNLEVKQAPLRGHQPTCNLLSVFHVAIVFRSRLVPGIAYQLKHITPNAPATEGATMGPPADMEYAVEPLGVEMISPSACYWTAYTKRL